jgi:hypothetical protein
VYIEDVGDAPLIPGQIIRYEDYLKIVDELKKL